jgi:hypothetical protein
MRKRAQPLGPNSSSSRRRASMGKATRREELIQLGWRAGIGAALIAGGYLALLLIPLVLASDFDPKLKAALTALIGFTPLLT